MRLAVFTSFSGQGGVERMVLNLIPQFIESGYSVELLALKAKHLQADALPPEVKLIRLKSRHSATVVNELAHYLKTTQPPAMLVAKDRPGRAALKARRKAKVSTRVVVRLGTNLSAALRHRNALQRWLRQVPVQRGYRDVDAIVAVSAGVADDTQRITGLPKTQIEVIRNPVITPRLDRLANEPLDDPWIAAQQTPWILGAGRLTLQKDFATLVRAFNIVQRTVPVRLVILGEGNQRPELEALIRSLGLTQSIHLPGYQKNPYPYLKHANLFVLSSRWEGSPNVLTEAAALGTAVVSTDCPSGPAELLQGGRYGPLVPVGDVAALAAAMLETLSNPLDGRMLQTATQDYRADVSARRYLELLYPKAVRAPR